MFFKVSALFSALQSFGQRFCLCSFEMAWDGGRDVQNVGDGVGLLELEMLRTLGNGEKGENEEGEQVLKDCEGPVADSQVGKQANLLFFLFLIYFLNYYLVLLHCLVLTLSKSTGILLQIANHYTIPHPLEMKMHLMKLHLEVRSFTVQGKMQGL